ncbi:unnamed protein product [Amoebophrya sp. A25]|nr:unnamed protein product [Amoebophrya sp. A25]|eukprot:GSA25T00010850001.1
MLRGLRSSMSTTSGASSSTTSSTTGASTATVLSLRAPPPYRRLLAQKEANGSRRFTFRRFSSSSSWWKRGSNHHSNFLCPPVLRAAGRHADRITTQIAELRALLEAETSLLLQAVGQYYGSSATKTKTNSVSDSSKPQGVLYSLRGCYHFEAHPHLRIRGSEVHIPLETPLFVATMVSPAHLGSSSANQGYARFRWNAALQQVELYSMWVVDFNFQSAPPTMHAPGLAAATSGGSSLAAPYTSSASYNDLFGSAAVTAVSTRPQTSPHYAKLVVGSADGFGNPCVFLTTFGSAHGVTHGRSTLPGLGDRTSRSLRAGAAT